MTALSLIVQPQAAYLLTDTASYLDDGTIVHFGPKVCEMYFGTDPIFGPPARTAIAMTGCVGAVEFAQKYLARFALSDVTQLLRELPVLFGEFCKAVERAPRQPGCSEKCVALALATYIPGHGASGWVIGNEYNPFPAEHYKAFTLMKVTNYVMRTGVKLPDRDYTDPKQFDPVRDCGELLDAQRLDPFGTDEKPFYAIGGTGVLTEVGAGGVRYHALRHWDDKVGELISVA